MLKIISLLLGMFAGKLALDVLAIFFCFDLMIYFLASFVCRYAEKREKASQILNDMDFLPR